MTLNPNDWSVDGSMYWCKDVWMDEWTKEGKFEVTCKYRALGHFVLEVLTLIANTGDKLEVSSVVLNP